jgi:hypothetical protein
MDKHLLAQQLRQRQYTRSHLSRHLIDAIYDKEVMDCYITCSCCGEKQVTPQQLEAAIAQALDAYHFLTICDEQAGAASRGHIQPPTPDLTQEICSSHTQAKAMWVSFQAILARR